MSMYLIGVDQGDTEDKEHTEFVDDALIHRGNGFLVSVQQMTDGVTNEGGAEKYQKNSNILHFCDDSLQLQSPVIY